MPHSGPPASPSYARHHWAKADRDGGGRVHLLEHHLADVGACFEALARQPTIRDRLARAAGRGALHDSAIARLSAFAALHDIGKVNMGFQTRIWDAADLRGRRKPPWAGHTSDIAPVLTGDDRETGKWFFDALGWDEILDWDADNGMTSCALFAAAMSHHGEPISLFSYKAANPAAWRPFAGVSPEGCVRRVGALVRRWFPDAFAADAPPLPSAPQFQHLFLGLCELADWIGSNERDFPYCGAPDDDYMSAARAKAQAAVAGIGLDIGAQRRAFNESGLPKFADLFPHIGGPNADGEPNAIQRAAYDAPLDAPVVVVESETGSGKTEAALWRFGRMYERGLADGMYFALPTRAAARQLHGRMTRFAGNMFPAGHAPETVLAVPGYIQAGDFIGKRLPHYDVWWEHGPDDHSRRRLWAAESAKRFLAAQLAVGTVDQAMLGALQVRHSHMRLACLSRSLLVVDEVHASDPYMRVIIEALLNAHVGAGGYALLMSATLGSAARRRWLLRPRRASDVPRISADDAIAAPYPAVSAIDGDNGGGAERVKASGGNNQTKRVRIDGVPLMDDFAAVAKMALDAARRGAKTLIVRNTVGYAVDTQLAVEDAAGDGDAELLFRCGGNDVPAPHTGRFAAADRAELDAAIEARVGKERGAGGLVVAGTQTLEQSLDIDADLLITDLCPMDALLQRIGRLHRHSRGDRPRGYEKPRCVVLLPDGDLAPRAAEESGPVGAANGLGSVYPDLRVLELTRRLVADGAGGAGGGDAVGDGGGGDYSAKGGNAGGGDYGGDGGGNGSGDYGGGGGNAGNAMGNGDDSAKAGGAVGAGGGDAGDAMGSGDDSDGGGNGGDDGGGAGDAMGSGDDSGGGGNVWRIPEMNRELVERATHPDELDALVGTDAGWLEHRNKVDGDMLADDLTAKDALLRLDKPFIDRDAVFADMEAKARTRLGDEGVEVKFCPQPPSPFDPDTAIEGVSIPGHMSVGLTGDESVAPECLPDGGFVFAVEGRRFQYGRLGLQRLD